ncbi:LysR family transcriptional regulator [Nonomuraea sp. NPDC050643]|uniref:LysR family transcriptional regulator n=1 Tax=Nonomuraea sp. NPDC050643 TaxID=3155660 RepID=UPI0033E85F0F
MSPLSLDLLRTFLAVHRTGSVTAAAQTLGLSQPAVTAQVKALESTLDRPLFDRLPRGVAPTPAADELARRVAPALDSLDEVVESELPTGEAVHLGGPAEFLCEVVMPMLAPLVRDGLRLRFTLGLSDDLLTDLAAGRLDLVLSTIRPRLRGVLSAVRAGMGVSVLPAYLCRRDLAAGTLVRLAEPEEAPIDTGYLAVRSGAEARPAVARVRAHLVKELRAAPSY